MQHIFVAIIIFIYVTAVFCVPLNEYTSCVGKPNGQYMNGYGCNQTYIHCLYGLTIINRCPEDLYFSLYSGRCTKKRAIAKCEQPSKEYQLMMPARCAGEHNKCRADGPCSNDYSCCINGIPQEKRCPKQYDEFDNASNKCVPSDCIKRDGSFGHPYRLPNPFSIEEMMDAWIEAAKRNRFEQEFNK